MTVGAGICRLGLSMELKKTITGFFISSALGLVMSLATSSISSANNQRRMLVQQAKPVEPSATTTEHRVGIGPGGDAFHTMRIDGKQALLQRLQTTKTTDGHKIIYHSDHQPTGVRGLVRRLIQKGQRFELNISGRTRSIAVQTESSSVELTSDEQQKLAQTIKTLSAINEANIKGTSNYRVEPFVPGWFKSKKNMLITDFVIRLLDGKNVGINVFHGEKRRSYKFKQLDQFWSWIIEHESLLDEPNHFNKREKALEAKVKTQGEINVVNSRNKRAAKEARKRAYDNIDTKTKLLITDILAGRAVQYSTMKGSWTHDSGLYIKIPFRNEFNMPLRYKSLEEQFVATGEAHVKFNSFSGQKLANGKSANVEYDYRKSFRTLDEIVAWANDVTLID